MTKREASHGAIPTCRLNPKKSGWMQRRQGSSCLPHDPLHPGRGGTLGAVGWRAGVGAGRRLKQPRRDPSLGRFHQLPGDSSCPGVWAS